MPRIAIIKSKFYSDYGEASEFVCSVHNWEEISEEDLKELQSCGHISDAFGNRYHIIEESSINEYKTLAKDAIAWAKKENELRQKAIAKNEARRKKLEETKERNKVKRELNQLKKLKDKYEDKKN